MKVNARRVEKSVAMPLSIAPNAIKMAPIPAAFLIPILSATIPLGIAYLASYIREHGHKVSCLDALIEGYENSPILIKGKRRTLFHYVF